MIRRLELNNWKKHNHLTLNFTNGLNGITGPNWAGKSSILYAILYCLGGSSVVPGSKLISKGMNSGFKQIMEFTAKGEVYAVKRTKTGAKLYHEESLIADGTTPVNDKIEELLGMSLKRFKQLRYAEQKKTASILTVGATELHKILEDLTGVEDINVVLSKLGTAVPLLTGELAGLAVDQDEVTEMKRQQTYLTDRQAGLQNTAASLKGDIALATKVMKDDQATLGVLVDAAEKIERADQAVLFASSRKAKADQALASANLALSGLEEPEAAGPLRDLVTKYTQELTLHRGIHKSVVAAEQAKASNVALNPNESKQKRVLRATTLLAGLKNPPVTELAAARELCATLKAKTDHLSEEVEALDTSIANAVCRACKRPFEGSDLAKAQAERAEASAAADESAAAWVASQSARRELALQAEEYLSAEADFNTATKALESWFAEAERIDNLLADLLAEQAKLGDRDELEHCLEEAETKVTKLMERSTAWARMTASLSFATSAVIEEEANLTKADLQRTALGETPDPEQVQRLMRSVQDAQRQLTHAAATLEQESADLTVVIRDLARVEGTLEDRALREERAKGVTTTLRTHKNLQKFLRDNRDRFLQEQWNSFMVNASTFSSAVTGGDIQEVIRFENGQFGFREDDAEEMTLKEASGAQESIMGLGVQQAMAMAAHCGLDLVLMDEPTADMTDEVSMASLNMLAADGRQIIMVSHNRLDTSCFNNLIEL